MDWSYEYQFWCWIAREIPWLDIPGTRVSAMRRIDELCRRRLMDYLLPTPGPLKPFPHGNRLIVCCQPGDPYFQDVPGAQFRDCWQCDRVVRASPESQKLEARGGHIIMCVQCVAAYSDAGIAITAITGGFPHKRDH
jgi:hypothetical protein